MSETIFLKLIGFSVWERRGGNGRNVTFPARQYSGNGERRSFALLRPIADANAHERIGAYHCAARLDLPYIAKIRTQSAHRHKSEQVKTEMTADAAPRGAGGTARA